MSKSKITKNNIAIRLKKKVLTPEWLRHMYRKKYGKLIAKKVLFPFEYGRCNDILKNHVSIRVSEAKNIAVILEVEDYRDLLVK